MASLNKVFLMGNITRDPEVRHTSSGLAVTDLSLAVNRRFTSKDGDSKEETVFVDITVWGRQAETSGEYLRKGSPVMVEGRLKLDQWEDKQSGEKRKRLGVVAENVQFMGSPSRGASVGDAPSRPPSAESAPGGNDFSGKDEEDIPF